MVVTRKGIVNYWTVFSGTEQEVDMHFQLGLLTPIDQSQEHYQRITLLSQVGVLQGNIFLIINS